jgi:hypothetical protein
VATNQYSSSIKNYGWECFEAKKTCEHLDTPYEQDVLIVHLLNVTLR